MTIEMVQNTLAMERVKFVYIMARESDSESEVWVWGKITPQRSYSAVLVKYF